MLLIIFSIIALAYIIPNNSPPWNSFHSDFLAVLFSIILGFTCIKKETKLYSYHIIALFIILLSGIWTIALDNAYNTYFFIGSLYLSSSILCFDYAKNVDNKKSIEYLFIALIFSSIISLAIQLAQATDITERFFPWILENPEGGRFFGNLGQPNQLATLICTSFVGSLYLLNIKKISSTIQIVLSVCFSLSLALAGSKTSLLSIAVLAIFLIFLKNKRKSYFLRTLFLFLLIFIFKEVLPLNSRNYSASDISTGRLDMWKMLLHAIMENPWIGYGFNNTVLANFHAIEAYPASWNKITAHSHNLFIDLIIWFGIPLGAFISFLIINIAYKFIIKQPSTEKKLIAYSAIPLIIHATLEFPLHYAYFLSILGFIAGATWQEKPIFNSRLINRLSLIYCTTLGLLVTNQYFELEDRLREQRFFLQNFEGSKKQKEIKSIYLDLPENQYNFLVRNEVTEENLKEMEKIAKYYPTFRSFYILCNYYLMKNMHTEFNVLKNKAIHLLPSDQAASFKELFKHQTN